MSPERFWDKKVTRRLLLKGSGATAFGALVLLAARYLPQETQTSDETTNGSRQRQPNQEILGQIPEVTVPVNGKVATVDNVRNKSTADVGIDRLLLLAADDPPVVFVFAEFASYASGIPLALRRKNPQLETRGGFVPYDQEFDVQKSLEIIKSRNYRGIALPMETAAQASLVFRSYSNKRGGLTYYPLPRNGQDLMYVFAENLVLLNSPNGPQLSKAAILRVKFRFVGHDADQSSMAQMKKFTE